MAQGSQLSAPGEQTQTKQAVEQHIVDYESQYKLYALAFCNRKANPYRIACGSFRDDVSNTVEIINLNPQLGGFQRTCSFEHEFPPTKIMWSPQMVRNILSFLG